MTSSKPERAPGLAAGSNQRTASVDRGVAMAELRARAIQEGARVFGEGDPAARLMLVGEAPGRAEVDAGRPFVGPAGVVLSRLLERLSIERRDLWITNVVKIRPTAIGLRGDVNRSPTAEEVTQFRDVLDREIELVRPKVILCLGAIAASTLIHPKFQVRTERGLWFARHANARISATYHPSYLLRLRGPRFEAVRNEMLADLSAAWGEAIGESDVAV